MEERQELEDKGTTCTQGYNSDNIYTHKRGSQARGSFSELFKFNKHRKLSSFLVAMNTITVRILKEQRSSLGKHTHTHTHREYANIQLESKHKDFKPIMAGPFTSDWGNRKRLQEP